MKKLFFLLSLLSIGSIGAVIIKNDTRLDCCVFWKEQKIEYQTKLLPGKNVYLARTSQNIQVEKQRKRKQSLWLPVATQNFISIRKVIAQHNKRARKEYQVKGEAIKRDEEENTNIMLRMLFEEKLPNDLLKIQKRGAF